MTHLFLCALVSCGDAPAEPKTAPPVGELRIETITRVLQGWVAPLAVTYHGPALTIDSLSLRVAYDSTALAFVDIYHGPQFDDSAFVIKGIANTALNLSDNPTFRTVTWSVKNVAWNFDSVIRDGDTIATIRFRVTNDRNYGCSTWKVKWMWVDEFDNTLWRRSTAHIGLATVEELPVPKPCRPLRDSITNTDNSLPSLAGPPFDPANYVSGSVHLSRSLIFQSGALRVICNEIDDRGDLNLNGLAGEEADVELFAQYFVEGLDAFKPHIESAIAASEINRNGIPLELEDLAALTWNLSCRTDIRKPDSERDTVHVTIIYDTLRVDKPLSAAIFLFKDSPNYSIAQPHVRHKSGVPDSVAVVVLYAFSDGINAPTPIGPGAVLLTENPILEMELIDTTGNRLITALEQ